MSKSYTALKEKKEMVASPPWHSVALVGILVAVFSSMFPSMDIVDRDATIEIFTQSNLSRLDIGRATWLDSMCLCHYNLWDFLLGNLHFSRLATNHPLRAQIDTKEECYNSRHWLSHAAPVHFVVMESAGRFICTQQCHCLYGKPWHGR